MTLQAAIDDILATVDKKFLDTVNEIIAHAEAMKQRRKWRDGKGLVHILAPLEAIEVMTAKHSIRGWVPMCGHRYESTVVHDPDLPASCLICITKDIPSP